MRAKRGDLAVIVTHMSDYVIGQGAQEHDQVDICEVTSITRDGIVKAVHRAAWGTTMELKRWCHAHEVYIVPKSDIDVGAAIKEAKQHPWPHNGMPGMYYESLAEAKAVLSKYRKA